MLALTRRRPLLALLATTSLATGCVPIAIGSVAVGSAGLVGGGALVTDAQRSPPSPDGEDDPMTFLGGAMMIVGLIMVLGGGAYLVDRDSPTTDRMLP